MPSSNDDNMIKFGSFDENNEIIVMIIPKNFITNVIIKLNLNHV